MNHMYYFFGLYIESEIQLPIKGVCDQKNFSTPDVTIEYGHPPIELTNIQHKGVRFQTGLGEFLLNVDSVARYYVTNGNRIVIEPHAGVEVERILIFLMGSAFGALLQQRNILVLHASAIESEKQSFVFSGVSGAGKSTLAAGFYHRGYSFLSDDVCAIAIINNRPCVIPGFPQLKLWSDVLTRLNKDKAKYQSVRWTQNLDKYFIPVESVSTTPLPLKSVFILEAINNNSIEVKPFRGMQKIGPLLKNTYRARFINGMGSKKEHFRQCSSIAAQTSIYHVTRPHKGFLLEQLMDIIEDKF